LKARIKGQEDEEEVKERRRRRLKAIYSA